MDGSLWRDLEGVTHVLWGWRLDTYDQVTVCSLTVRYRRGDWLYEALGLAPTFTNCVVCAADTPYARKYNFLGTITGRMSYNGDFK